MQEEFLQDTELKTKSSSRQIEPLVSTHFLPPEKFILDVCCGCRQFWFDKKQANTVYMDIRREEKGFQDVRPNKEIQPDIVADFRRLPFPDERFKLVVMDPPHIISEGPLFRMTKEYGWLEQDTWTEDIRKGVEECWRVLEWNGVFVFKWNEASVDRATVLQVIKWEPLFGHPVLSKIGTHWFTFMKLRGQKMSC
jgi:SAM-dependent methyltransferase